MAKVEEAREVEGAGPPTLCIWYLLYARHYSRHQYKSIAGHGMGGALSVIVELAVEVKPLWCPGRPTGQYSSWKSFPFVLLTPLLQEEIANATRSEVPPKNNLQS